MFSANLNMFGPLELFNVETHQQVQFSYQKLILLLAYLAIEPKTHTRDSLADLLWPEFDADHAKANLRRALFNLQQAFVSAGLQTSMIHKNRSSISLSKDVFLVDLFEFDKATLSGDMALLNQQINLYKGTLLDGISPKDEGLADWLQAKRAWYEQKFISLLERSILLAVNSGIFAAIESQCQRLIVVDQINELAHLHLIHLYLENDHEIAAIKIYNSFTDALQQQLGIDPPQQIAMLLRGHSNGSYFSNA
jgi:DNA-binding SARP family transcriptional activator